MIDYLLGLLITRGPRRWRRHAQAVARWKLQEVRMLLEKYCTCGAVLKRDVARRKAQQALIVWTNTHSGEGHEPCTAAQAEAARMGSSVGYGRESRRAQR